VDYCCVSSPLIYVFARKEKTVVSFAVKLVIIRNCVWVHLQIFLPNGALCKSVKKGACVPYSRARFVSSVI
jgi:hypothetical protein